MMAFTKNQLSVHYTIVIVMEGHMVYKKAITSWSEQDNAYTNLF